MHDATAYIYIAASYTHIYVATPVPIKMMRKSYLLLHFYSHVTALLAIYVAMYAVIGILRVILVSSFAAMVAADAPHIEYERTGSCSVSIIL